MSPPAHPAAPAGGSTCEASRYALLRRLAPSMRHHLVVNLQPIGMIYEVMDRRLRAGQPDLGEIHGSAQKINGFSRAALQASIDVVTWLAPSPEATIPVEEGIRECLGLIATNLTFRGFALRNDVADASAPVSRAALRNVLTASLLHLTDENPSPAEVVLGASVKHGAALIDLSLRPSAGEAAFAPELPYRAIAWADVEAIAIGESAMVMREGPQRIAISIPLAKGA